MGAEITNETSLLLSFTVCVSVCLCVCAHACAQSCPALCNLRDCSLLGSSVYGIFQARILEWGAISSSRAFILSHHSHETKDDALSFFKPGCKQLLTAKPSSPWWAIRCQAHQRGWSTLGTAVHRSELWPSPCCLLVAGTANTGLFTVISPCRAPIRSDAAAESCFLFPSSLGATAFFFFAAPSWSSGLFGSQMPQKRV